jgi:hypothetical protein
MTLILLLLRLLLDFLHYEFGIIWDYRRATFREQKIAKCVHVMYARFEVEVRTRKEPTNLLAIFLPLNYGLELRVMKFWK